MMSCVKVCHALINECTDYGITEAVHRVLKVQVYNQINTDPGKITHIQTLHLDNKMAKWL